jgi:acetate kinase
LRKLVCDRLKALGVKIDDKLNEAKAQEISTKDSKVRVFVINTNEEVVIARETLKLIKRKA